MPRALNGNPQVPFFRDREGRDRPVLMRSGLAAASCGEQGYSSRKQAGNLAERAAPHQNPVGLNHARHFVLNVGAHVKNDGLVANSENAGSFRGAESPGLLLRAISRRCRCQAFLDLIDASAWNTEQRE